MIGCKTGNRSLTAAKKLLAAGFSQIVEQRAGFGGARDAFGRLEPGWQAAGLPVATQPSRAATTRREQTAVSEAEVLA